MLQISSISKKYITGDLVQEALNEVSVNFRDNEFVAVLGPSGSGKTTLLNIIGGLDRYDSGDLIINDISTKKYKDRDWDSYRNHTIGFVFQSYNLIPHQNILSNVELALTISGVSKKERKKRAKKALEKVGLGNQLHKKPNQMSGGQMQRVAIARALINDPDILLADEPTGALDTETSIQVMELLKEVAKDRLVVMVTHNPELADEYATRIVKLRDGRITDDSDPFTPETKKAEKAVHKNMGKSSMSLLTSLSLSFNNLKTKKGRTILTSFAGSIGIIGIALILAFSNGVNTYINNIQRDTMTAYPLTINAESVDMSKLMAQPEKMKDRQQQEQHVLDSVYSNSMYLEMANTASTSLAKNNLTDFKKYLDNPESEIRQYLGTSGIIYSYDTVFDMYSYDSDGTIVSVQTNPYTPDSLVSTSEGAVGQFQQSMMKNMTSMMGTDQKVLEELLPGKDGEMVSGVVKDSYDLVSGNWPESYQDVVLILNDNNEIDINVLYSLGLVPAADYKALVDDINKGNEINPQTYSYSYNDIIGKKLFLVSGSDLYTENDNGTFSDNSKNRNSLSDIAQNATEIRVSGIIRPVKDDDKATLTGYVGYTNALTDYLIDYANDSDVVKAQVASPEINVLNGLQFSPSDDSVKIEEIKKYISEMGISDKAKLIKDMSSAMSMQGDSSDSASQQMPQIDKMPEQQLAAMTDQFISNADDATLISMYDYYISAGTYEDNLKAFGYISKDAPTSINIYADTFKDKEAIVDSITHYNNSVSESDKIVYTDFVGMMTSSMTTILDVITYVLIAFVAVSLIVSSIMIGIITYISVLERTKEIGILRALGASKHNISAVFNSETFIIGLLSGIIGIGVTCLLLIPINAILAHLIKGATIVAEVPLVAALVLILLSIVLTLIGGFIPSKKAARKDPVTALRSE